MMREIGQRRNLHNGPAMGATLILRLVTPLAFAALVTACTTSPSASQSAVAGPSMLPSPSPPASESSLPTPAPSGFGFSVEAVIAYYESRGFTCEQIEPSATAAGYFFQGCQMVDPGGRTLALGFVTDSSGDLSDGYASVQGRADEPILEPTDALDHLSGFLGAMLGEVRGTSLLEWLAGHLGDAYAQTTVDVLVVATYTQSPADHSRLYLEIADQDYINAPRPSASP
jgi:hypothetical protein